ncbi:hypothetical protein DIPPA_01984 [Diplonema papillatum]|nr:hypothetical protein DIPPA_01984 [Diplonema papillatum]
MRPKARPPRLRPRTVVLACLAVVTGLVFVIQSQAEMGEIPWGPVHSYDNQGPNKTRAARPPNRTPHRNLPGTGEMLLDAIAKALARGKDYDPATTIPVFGMLCTPADAHFAATLLESLDVGVQAFHVTLNGGDPSAHIVAVFENAAARFGPEQFTFRHTAMHAGVAAGWNEVLRHGFNQLRKDFVVVGSPHLHPKPGYFAQYLAFAQEEARNCGVISFEEWALFGVTRSAYEKLGYFDENFWPAGGEDIEMTVRAQASDVAVCTAPDMQFHNLGAANSKTGGGLQKQVTRHDNGKAYLFEKWGVDIHKQAIPITGHFRHPFNDARVPTYAWLYDKGYRQCVQEGGGRMDQEGQHCLYNTKKLLPKLVAGALYYNQSVVLQSSPGLQAANAGQGYMVVAPSNSSAVANKGNLLGVAVASMDLQDRTLFDHLSLVLARGQTEPSDEVVPAFGMLCTSIDASFARRLFSSFDVGVQRFHVIFNGQDPRGEILPFLKEASRVLGEDKFFFRHNEANAGVAVGWNQMRERAFEVAGVDLLMIGNADLIPKAGSMAAFLRYARSESRVKTCGVLHFNEWALFGLTRFGYEQLGSFDENIWPAYGEDIEMIVRAQASNVALCTVPGMSFTHLGSVNFKKNRALQAQVSRHHNGKAYLLEKWGFDIHKRTNPITGHFMHPFNDARVPKTAWLYDKGYRQCVEHGGGLMDREKHHCLYHTAELLPKLTAGALYYNDSVVAPPTSTELHENKGNALSVAVASMTPADRTLLDQVSLVLTRGQTEPSDEVVPAFGMLCTSIDASFARRLFGSFDVGVQRFHVIFNGQDPRGEILPFLKEASRVLGEDKFFFRHNEANAGVAVGWNQMRERAFEVAGVDLLMIGNADLIPMPWSMAAFLRYARSESRVKTCGVLHFNEWALFGLTRFGYEQLGSFDENIWPAYGEDIEMIVRAQASNVALCTVPGVASMHLGSVNFKSNGALQAQVSRHHNGKAYLLEKWGFDIHKRTNPITGHFMHPFNDARVPKTAWLYDKGYRQCVEHGGGLMDREKHHCLYHTAELLPKLTAGALYYNDSVVAPPTSTELHENKGNALSVAVASMTPADRTLLDQVSLVLTRGQTEPSDEVVPAFGMLCTSIDASFARRLFGSFDVGVQRFHVIFNGQDPRGEILPFLKEASRVLGEDKFFFRHNEANAGVAVGWNQMRERAFEVAGVDLLMIGNADLIPKAGSMAAFLRYARSESRVKTCGVLHFNEWALFGLTRFGYEQLGSFDENIWPAYGEDIEMIVRAQASNVALCTVPGMSFTHLGSVNFKKNRALQAQVSRHHNGKAYLLEKWGFDIHKRTNPITGHFMHPFNDARVPKTAWLYDKGYRQCVEHGGGLMDREKHHCLYHTAELLPKLTAGALYYNDSVVAPPTSTELHENKGNALSVAVASMTPADRTLLDQVSLVLTRGQTEPSDEVVPAFGMLCTSIDASFARRLFGSFDVGVQRFHVIFNGQDPRGEILPFLKEASRVLGEDKFFFRHNEANAGVAVGWNQMRERAFEVAGVDLLMIGNADLIPKAGSMAAFLRYARSESRVKTCGVLHFNEWALFGLTRFGYEQLGSFDENIWPAYGEDIEMIVRAQASNVALCIVPGMSFTHLGSVNFKRNGALQAQVSRHHNGKAYLLEKWGFDIHKRTNPITGHFMHPFNDARVPKTAWLYDKGYRQCVEHGGGLMDQEKQHCLYHTAELLPKLAAGALYYNDSVVAPPTSTELHENKGNALSVAVASMTPADRTLLDQVSLVLTRGQTEPSDEVVPAFGMLCTSIDASFARRLFGSFDVGVQRFHVIFNGQDPRGEILPFLKEASRVLGEDKFFFRHNEANAGVAVGWNQMRERAFEVAGVDLLMIGNADLIPKAGSMAAFLRYARSESRVKTCGVLHFNEWALFGLTRFGYEQLGSFDENIWPAYGEDIEMIVRAQASNVALCIVPGMSFTHLGSVNFKKNRALQAQVSRHHNGKAYLLEKWGFDIHKRTNPITGHFMHPFNDARVPKTAWLYDKGYRQCVEHGGGLMDREKHHCLYHTAELLPKLTAGALYYNDSVVAPPTSTELHENKGNALSVAVASMTPADRTLLDQVSLVLTRGQTEPSDEVVPAFGMLCTSIDASFARRLFGSFDVGVQRFHVIFNGQDPRGEILPFLKEASRVLGEDKFFFRHNEANAGVAVGWNQMRERAFEVAGVDLLMIGNADLIPKAGSMAAFLRYARSESRVKTCGVLHFNEWALFGLTRFGYEQLGSFDENIWPAYGEDIEMIVRAQASNVALCIVPGMSFTHLGSVNFKRNGALQAQVSRHHNGKAYLLEKWGFDIHKRTNPITGHFMHPFNDTRVPKTAWLYDTGYRQCVEHGGGLMDREKHHCLYHTAELLPKLIAMAQAEASPHVGESAEEDARLLKHLTTTLHSSGAAAGDAVVPAYGILCGGADASSVRGLLWSFDFGVRSVHVVFEGAENGTSVLAFLAEAQRVLGEDRFYVTHNTIPAGFTSCWNQMAHHAFGTVGAELLIIGRAGVRPEPGSLTEFLQIQARPLVSTCGAVRLFDWALFGFTRLGYEKLGLFDENVWPAGGGEIELAARAQAANVALCDAPGLSAKHVRRPTAEMDPAFGAYLRDKWGIELQNHALPPPNYRHPFNDSAVPISAWLYDPMFRHCLADEIARPCRYDTAYLVPLLAKGARYYVQLPG